MEAKRHKRGHGEGMAPRLRPDGRWEARVTLPNGKRKAVYGKTEGETRKKLRDALRALDAGQDLGQPSRKVADYLERDWLGTQKKHEIRPSTFDNYELNIRSRLIPHLGHHRLENLKPAHIQAAYSELLEGDLSPHSVRQAHRVLKAALRDAEKQGIIARNPANLVKLPRVTRREMKVLEPHQARQLLTTTAGDEQYPLWLVLLTTGMRVGEALGLHWRDVDLDAGSAYIRWTLHRVKGKGLLLGEPKTESSRRRIVLSPEVVDALRAHEARQQQHYDLRGLEWSEQGLLFTTLIGTPLDPSAVRSALHRALDRAGLPMIRVHDLRHTVATLLLSTGTPSKVVQELLGHSSDDVTRNVYGHVLPGQHEQAVAKLRDMLSG